MKKIILFIILLLGPSRVFSQQQVPLDEKHYLDSLQGVLQRRIADTLKADANFRLVEYWKVKDTVKSKAHLEQGKKLARKYPFYNALSLFYEGHYYYNWNKEKASVAFKKAEEALAAFQTKKAYDRRAAAWYNYALMNKDKKGYDFVTKITLEKAIPNAQKAGNPVVLAHYYTQLSTILMNNYQFAKATEYNEKAINLLEGESSGKTNLLFAYLSGVGIYCYDNQLPKAKAFLQKAGMLLANHSESLNYTLYYQYEALYYTYTKAYSKALASAAKGIVLAKKYNQTQLHQQFLFRQYEVYTQQKAYSKARQILLDIVEQGALIADRNNRAEIYGELAKTNEQMHDYKEAYLWLKRSREVTDSINTDQTKVKINEMETKYRSAQNKQKIATLQAQNKQEALSTKNNRLYNLFLALGCLFLLAVLGFVVLTARNRRKLSEQREINYRQQLSDMEQKQQLKVAKAMLEGEERERERIARDLHDGLGGMLAGVRIGLSGWSSTNHEVSQDNELNRVIYQLDTSVSELRRIARNMMPETLLKFGLEVALKDLCEFYMRDGLKISFESFKIEKNIPLNVQLNIFRIIQELISNAIKHARAKSILLQCSQNDDIFFITFEDDGIGFDTNTVSEKKSMGLDNLKNRIAFLNGTLEVQSAPDQGTTINIELNIRANG